MKLELSSQLSAISKKLGVKFVYNSKLLSYEEVFSPSGLLPSVAKRADQLCSLCLGYGLGVTFEDAENSTLGTQVRFDEVTPSALRLICFTDVIFELIKVSSNKELVSLDELTYD